MPSTCQMMIIVMFVIATVSRKYRAHDHTSDEDDDGDVGHSNWFRHTPSTCQTMMKLVLTLLSILRGEGSPTSHKPQHWQELVRCCMLLEWVAAANITTWQYNRGYVSTHRQYWWLHQVLREYRRLHSSCIGI
eukprot:3364382-Rhodomonas_salina.2